MVDRLLAVYDGGAMNEPRKLKKIAQGREAEIFAWEDGTVLRLLSDPSGAARLEAEARAMTAARAAGVSVPAVHATTTFEGRPGMIMERIGGADVLTAVGKQPWRIWWAGRVSGRLHAALHEVVAPDGLVSLRDMLRSRVERSPLVPDAVRKLALEAMEDLPDGDRICHGDFHPGNILGTDDEPVIIDWANVSRGDPAADFARSHLMIRIGDVPPGSPLVIRIGAHGLRGLLLGSYAGAYRRARPIDMELVRHWELPVAANRLVDNIPEERPALLKLLAARAQEG